MGGGFCLNNKYTMFCCLHWAHLEKYERCRVSHFFIEDAVSLTSFPVKEKKLKQFEDIVLKVGLYTHLRSHH